MTTVAVLAGVAVAATCVAVLVSLRLRAVSNDRFEAALERIDEHLGALVDHVRQAADRSSSLGLQARAAFEPSLDLDRLLADLVEEAQARCQADAAAVEIDGPGVEPCRAYAGDHRDTGVIHTTLRSLGSRPFEAMTVDWSAGAASTGEGDRLRSALVIPVVEEGAVTGALGVYAFAPGAFRPEQAQVLQSLVRDRSPAIANARRFAVAEERTTIDLATGVRNSKGHLEELDREIARCRRTGRPLSLVVLALDETREDVRPSRAREDAATLWELGCLLTEASRATDVVSRPQRDEFAFLLPDTTTTGAASFVSRLDAEVDAHTFALGRPVFARAGIAQWEPGESGDAFERRARSTMTPLGRVQAPRPGSVPERRGRRPAVGTRAELRDRLGRELAQARSEARQLSLLLVAPAELGGQRSSRAVPPDTEELLVRRLQDHFDASAAVYRLEEGELAILLPDASADAAADEFTRVRESLRAPPAGPTTTVTALYGGITEVASGDDPDRYVARARQALWQARQAGPGTAVVATTDGTPER